MDESHEPAADESSPEIANPARGRYCIVVKFLSYLSATWCGSVLLGLGAVSLLWSVRGICQALADYSGNIIDLGTQLALYVGFAGLVVFACAVAFGRFLLRAMPPYLFGQTRRRQLVVVAVASCAALIGIFICFGGVLAAGGVVRANQTAGYPGQMATLHRLVILAGLAGAALFTIVWATGAVGPLVLRHRRPRAFLDRPLVLFLRRFSTFSDRTVNALILRQAKAGVPIVFLTPTGGRPKDWDPFLVGFAGLKLMHPLSSVPIVLRARDDDWQRVADELIRRAQTILVDTSEGSVAIQTEAEMIAKAGRWSDTVCLRDTAPPSASGQDPLGAFTKARCIDYSKSWMRAIPRLGNSPEHQHICSRSDSDSSGEHLFLSFLIFLVLVLILNSIFWRPAVSRNTKIELNRALRAKPFTSLAAS